MKDRKAFLSQEYDRLLMLSEEVKKKDVISNDLINAFASIDPETSFFAREVAKLIIKLSDEQVNNLPKELSGLEGLDSWLFTIRLEEKKSVTTEDFEEFFKICESSYYLNGLTASYDLWKQHNSETKEWIVKNFPRSKKIFLLIIENAISWQVRYTDNAKNEIRRLFDACTFDMRNDRDIAKALITSFPYEISLVQFSNDVRSDKELIIDIAKVLPISLKEVSEEILEDEKFIRDFLLNAINPFLEVNLSKHSTGNNIELAKLACRINPRNYSCFKKEVLYTRELALEYERSNPASSVWTPDIFMKNPDFIKEVMPYSPDIRKRIAKEDYEIIKSELNKSDYTSLEDVSAFSVSLLNELHAPMFEYIDNNCFLMNAPLCGRIDKNVSYFCFYDDNYLIFYRKRTGWKVSCDSDFFFFVKREEAAFYEDSELTMTERAYLDAKALSCNVKVIHDKKVSSYIEEFNKLGRVYFKLAPLAYYYGLFKRYESSEDVCDCCKKHSDRMYSRNVCTYTFLNVREDRIKLCPKCLSKGKLKEMIDQSNSVIKYEEDPTKSVDYNFNSPEPGFGALSILRYYEEVESYYYSNVFFNRTWKSDKTIFAGYIRIDEDDKSLITEREDFEPVDDNLLSVLGLEYNKYVEEEGSWENYNNDYLMHHYYVTDKTGRVTASGPFFPYNVSIFFD